MVIIIIAYAIFAVLAGIMAEKRNRSVSGWVILTVLLSPLVLLILLALGPSDGKAESFFGNSGPYARAPLDRRDGK